MVRLACCSATPLRFAAVLLAVPSRCRRGYQSCVNGELYPVPQRQAVSDDFESPSIEHVDPFQIHVTDNCVGPHSRSCFSAYLCLGLQTEGLRLDPRYPAGGDRRERDRRQASALGPHQGSLRVGQPWPTLLVVELLVEATRGFLRESKVLIAWHHLLLVLLRIWVSSRSSCIASSNSALALDGTKCASSAVAWLGDPWRDY